MVFYALMLESFVRLSERETEAEGKLRNFVVNNPVFVSRLGIFNSSPCLTLSHPNSNTRRVMMPLTNRIEAPCAT